MITAALAYEPLTTENEITLQDVFIALCGAKFLLVQAGDDLHDAVDDLQRYAVESGLVDAIGQDAIQAIISQAFEVAS